MPAPPVRTTRSLFLAASILASGRLAAAGVLYDGSIGTLPGQQSWLYLCDLGCGATQVAQGGVTTLDSTARIGDHAGYFAHEPDPPLPFPRHPQLPPLDRASGYQVRFDLQIGSEDHRTNVNRAGFSLIVIGEDLKGVELGFWEDEVWAQSDAPVVFRHAEGAAFDTTAAMTRYELCVLGDTYALSAGGVEILGGSLRDYYAADQCNCCPFPVPCPYNNPGIFAGDDTTSALARFDLAWIEATAGLTPPAIGNTLTAIRSGSAILFAVDPAAPASTYRLYRDSLPGAAGTTLHAVSPSVSFPPDGQSLADPGSFYFVATGIGPCGGEFP